MEATPKFYIFVYTGDRKRAGTNNTVQIRFHGSNGKATEAITLNSAFSNDLEKNHIDTFKVDPKKVDELDPTGTIERIELWKHSLLGLISDDWYLNKIVVENANTNQLFVFPFFRWIKSGYHYNITHLDTSLPQNELFPEQRKKELDEKKRSYQYYQKLIGGPVQVKKLPADEQFSFDYKWDLAKLALEVMTASKISAMAAEEWESFEDMKHVFRNEAFERPRYADNWDSDVNFGRQRLSSLNSSMVTLLTEIPDKFPVTDELLGKLLQGMSLHQALIQRRLYIIDYYLLDGITTKKGYQVCAPVALFFVDERKRFLPVAIQLFQRPGSENPIFTPNDPPMLWKYVKMWFNNADSSYHQSVTHLGFTHFLMEGIAINTHRNLSASHPVFKLLAPHFLYLISINWSALETLIADGGWVDQTMSVGSKGMKTLVMKGFDNWRMDEHGNILEDFKSRGVDDVNMLPSYYFRDDSTMLYKVVHKYVKSYVDIYYTSHDILTSDGEIQAWAYELVKERNNTKGGCGLKGVPGNGDLKSMEDLVAILTSVIFTCSVVHAAVNFPQYDEYGFIPNYPAIIKGAPPTSKAEVITEKDIVANMPDPAMTLEIMTQTTILSSRSTFRLGDFEMQYVFDPKALEVVEQFRKDLDAVSKHIRERNVRVHEPYDYLDPDNIPNAISI